MTGATGFIGGRLVEALVAEGARVRALVRAYGRAAEIARYGVEMIPGDVLDANVVARASVGCDLAFHCAVAAGGSPDQQRAVSVDGAANVARATLASGSRRMVHFSSVAVHGRTAPTAERVDEASLLSPDPSDIYASVKADAERVLWTMHAEEGLPLAVVRPAVVYGPRSQWWTVNPVRQMCGGRFHLVDDGSGTCNPVYVDDVVEAALRSAVDPCACGRSFIVAGPPVSWREFFGYYARMAGIAIDDLPSWDDAEIRALRRRQRLLHSSAGTALALVASPRVRNGVEQVRAAQTVVGVLRRLLPGRLREWVAREAIRLYEIRRRPVEIPTDLTLASFRSRRIYVGAATLENLGFAPRVSLEDGMARTAEWLVYAGYLPSAVPAALVARNAQGAA